MLELHQVDGWTQAEIAEAFGTWPDVVSRIIARERVAPAQV